MQPLLAISGDDHPCIIKCPTPHAAASEQLTQEQLEVFLLRLLRVVVDDVRKSISIIVPFSCLVCAT